MNLNDHPSYHYDAVVPSEILFRNGWDGDAVSNLIRAKTNHGESPAFLFLGRVETELLREHLAETFGDEAVAMLNGTYYMGLVVITVDCENFLCAAGRKTIRPTPERPAWRDRDTHGLWQFRI